MTREQARAQIAHYTRAAPADTKLANALKLARVIALGDPTRDLQTLESLAAHCKDAGHYLRVFRMSGHEAREILLDKARAQYEQEARAAAKKAAEKAAEKPSPSQPFYYPPFDEAEYLTRCAEYAALMVLDAGAGCG